MRKRFFRRQGRSAVASAVGKRGLPLVALEGLEGRSLFSASLVPQGDITIPTQPQGQAFGLSVATQGNLALVGSGSGSTALYDTSTNTLIATYFDATDPDGSLGHGFGDSVTFLGEGQGFAIGAPNDGGGKVYLYMSPTSAPAVLTAEAYVGYSSTVWQGGVAGFGTTLAGYHGHLLVDTPNDATHNGLVQEIDPVSGGVLRTFASPDAAAGGFDGFGDHMAVSGDQILFHAQPGGAGAGASVVYLFDGSDFTNDQGQVRAFADPAQEPQYAFGSSLAFDGDRVVIGAQLSAFTFDDMGNFDQSGSAVYEYSAASGEMVRTYAQPAAIPTQVGQSYVGWGYSLAIAGDRLLVSAPFVYNENFDFAGQVYAYDLGTGGELAHAAAPDAGGAFGGAMAGLADGRFVVTDPQSNAMGFGTGAAHLYAVVVDNPPPQTSPPVAEAGDDQTVLIDQEAAFDGSGSTADNGAAIVSYEWDFDYDGTNFDSDATGATSSHVYTATGTYTVALKVTDDHGKTSTDTLVVTVTLPPAPTADAGADVSALNGETVALSGGGTGAATFEWDLNYDGSTFDVDAAGAQSSVVYTASGAHVVALRVTDAYGQTAIDTLVVTTTAPAPTADAGASQTVNTGDTVTLAGTATAGLGSSVALVEWDFNYDGTTFTADATGATATTSYAAAGNYVVAMRVTDADGQWTVDTTLVTAVTPVPPAPVELVDGNLVVTAPTDSAGMFVFGRAAEGGVTVSSGGTNYGTFSPTGSIIIHGSPTGNLVIVPGNVSTPVVFIGGPGVDLVMGGSGNDILVGGGGVDVLDGGEGRDLIIGGGGTDVLVGNGEDDILIAGSTSYDNDPAALASILAEWTSGRSFTQRVNNLRNVSPTADRANGSVFLIADSTVFDDGARDVLSGNAGQDWYLFNSDKGIKDVVAGSTKGDLMTDLDLLPPQ